MTLYQKLFGLNLMAPAGDNDGGGGDRGDAFVATTTADETAAAAEAAAAAAAAAAAQEAEDLKVATGEKLAGEEDPARDAAGKFTKKDKGDEGATIPKSRFDSAVQKERERAEIAERRLAEIELNRAQVARGADISKLEQDVKELRAQERKALISGEDEKAATFSEQADRLNRQIALEQARDLSAADKERAREEIRMEMVIERIESDFPMLDENSNHFDQEVTDDVLDKQRGYMERERLSPSKALLKAVKYVLDRRVPVTEATGKDATGLSAAVKKTDDRKEAAVKKNLAAAAAQPGSTKAVGADSDKHGQNAPVPAAADMTYEEFAALPESTKAKMRGDLV